MVLVQTGIVLMLNHTIRHPLRFKVQLLCNLVLLSLVLQAEVVSSLARLFALWPPSPLCESRHCLHERRGCWCVRIKVERRAAAPRP